MKKNIRALIGALLLSAAVTACSTTNAGSNNNVDNPNNVYVTKVELNETDKTIDIGDSFTLTPTITFRNNEEKEVDKLWKSSVVRVATVDENGLVTAKASGTTYITFIAGFKAAGCKVTVAGGEVDPENPTPTPQPDDGFSLTLSSGSRSLDVGGQFELTATVSEEATVSWTNSNSAVASLSATSGLVVTINALAEGSTTITASAKEHTAKCVVNVRGAGGGEEDDGKDVTIYFFIDYNNIDENDETGTKLIKSFPWYGDRPIQESGLVPADPTVALDPAFPNFIGWSAHTIIDQKSDLWVMDKDTVYDRAGNTDYLFLYGIWSDVTKEAFTA